MPRRQSSDPSRVPRRNLNSRVCTNQADGRSLSDAWTQGWPDTRFGVAHASAPENLLCPSDNLSIYAADPIGYRNSVANLAAAAVDHAIRPCASARSVAFLTSISR